MVQMYSLNLVKNLIHSKLTCIRIGQVVLFCDWLDIFSSKAIKNFAYTLSKQPLPLTDKIKLFTSALYKKVFIVDLYDNVIKELKESPTVITIEELDDLLLGLANLGVELSRRQLISLHNIITHDEHKEKLNSENLVDFVFLAMINNELRISRIKYDIKNYIKIISKWSEKKILLDPSNANYRFSYSMKSAPDHRINKTKFQAEDLNLFPELTTGKKSSSKSRKNVYEIMATESKESEDIQFKEYMQAMAQHTTTHSFESSRKITINYEDFDIAGESVIKQWAILLEHGVLPRDKELYTYCKPLLMSRSTKLLSNISEKQEMIDTKNILTCPITGWLIDGSSKNIKRRVLDDTDFYTLINENGEHKQELLGCEKVIARQLKTIGGHEVRHLKIKNGSIQEIDNI